MCILEIKKPKRWTILGQVALLKEPRVHDPLTLVAVFFFVGHSVSLVGLKPFLMNIFRELEVSVPPYWTLVRNAKGCQERGTPFD